MAVAPRPEREAVIIINFLCHQSITQTNTLKNCMPTIAAFTPLSPVVVVSWPQRRGPT